MAKAKRRHYALSHEAAERLGVRGLMDMLRYDRAEVESNAPGGFYLLSSEYPSAPCIERWRSFGTRVLTGKGFGRELDEYAVVEECRSLTAPAKPSV